MNKHKRDHMDTVNVVMFVLNSVTFHHGAVLYPITILCGNKFRKYCRIWTTPLFNKVKVGIHFVTFWST